MKLWSRLLGAGIVCGALALSARAAELAWVELLTSGAPASAASFYEKTFGWTSERTGPGDWDAVILRRGERVVAGVAHREGERLAKARTRWVEFFAVPDAEAAGKAVETAGGRVLEPEHTGAARGGKQALLVDQEGAVFGVSSGGAAGEGGAARGFWPVVLANDTPGAAKFYRELLGGAIRGEGRTPLFAGDFLLTSNEKPWAGVQPTGVTGRPGWLLLIGVADIDATVKTARKEGAKVLREPLIDLIGGRVAVLADPMGGVFGLYETIPMKAGKAKPAVGGDFEVEKISR